MFWAESRPENKIKKAQLFPTYKYSLSYVKIGMRLTFPRSYFILSFLITNLTIWMLNFAGSPPPSYRSYERYHQHQDIPLLFMFYNKIAAPSKGIDCWFLLNLIIKYSHFKSLYIRQFYWMKEVREVSELSCIMILFVDTIGNI